MLKRLLTLATHKIYNLPVVVLMPHSRCNCRCVMCDIWKANHDKREISLEVLNKHIDAFRKLGVREIVLSGGEALMHSNLWKLCSLLKENNIKLTLLSTGLLLQKNATLVVEYFDQVIVSVDGTQQVHDTIRNIPEGFNKLKAGVQEIKKIKHNFKITGRCVIQRHNFFDFANIVKGCQEIGLDQISFLAADVSSSAFNRPEHWTADRVSEVALSKNETLEFEKIINNSIDSLKSEFDKKFIAESPEKIKKLVQYYKAVNGLANYPEPICNAPWVSAVIESDGSVMPCFFHKAYGNIFDNDLIQILNSASAVAFRKNLDMGKDEICKKCVCSLKLGITQMN